MAHDRATFQRLAELRLAEAKALAAQGFPSAAFYLAGYAIECALKARIATRFRADEIPDRKLVNRIFTHDLKELVELAGLQEELSAAADADADFKRRWLVIQSWSEGARYLFWTPDMASDMIEAVEGRDGTEGLFQWLTKRW